MARAGRKRKNVKRQPNGQPARSSREQREDMTSVVREARRRVFNISPQEADDMPETTVLGRLRAQGMAFERKHHPNEPMMGLTQRQYDAGVEYLRVIRERTRLVGAKGVQSGGDLEWGGGYDASDGTDPQYQDRYRRNHREFMAAQDAIREANNIDNKAGAVLDAVCLADWDVPYMIGTLRTVLNCLARAFNIGARGIDSDRKSVYAQLIERP